MRQLINILTVHVEWQPMITLYWTPDRQPFDKLSPREVAGHQSHCIRWIPTIRRYRTSTGVTKVHVGLHSRASHEISTRSADDEWWQIALHISHSQQLVRSIRQESKENASILSFLGSYRVGSAGFILNFLTKNVFWRLFYRSLEWQGRTAVLGNTRKTFYDFQGSE